MIDRNRIVSVMREIEQYVERRHFFPIIGPVKGELLYIFTLLKGPTSVLELGTGIGYSALQIARGLLPGAKIVTVEEDEENARAAQSTFRRAGIEDIVTLIVDEAGSFIRRNDSQYEMIFMDIEKSRYLDLLEDCVSRLRPQGILVTDNVLRPELKRFRQAIITHPQLISSIIHLEDGVSLSIKKA